MLTMKKIFEEICDCGDNIRHNNGGNYHSRGYIASIEGGDYKLYFEKDTRDFESPGAERIAIVKLNCGCIAVAVEQWRTCTYVHVLNKDVPSHRHDWDEIKKDVEAEEVEFLLPFFAPIFWRIEE